MFTARYAGCSFDYVSYIGLYGVFFTLTAARSRLRSE